MTAFHNCENCIWCYKSTYGRYRCAMNAEPHNVELGHWCGKWRHKLDEEFWKKFWEKFDKALLEGYDNERSNQQTSGD